jgi:hypothetical protein
LGYSKTWLNLLVDDHQCGDITKLKRKILIQNMAIFFQKSKKIWPYFEGKFSEFTIFRNMGFRRSPNYRRVQNVFYFSL